MFGRKLWNINQLLKVMGRVKYVSEAEGNYGKWRGQGQKAL